MNNKGLYIAFGEIFKSNKITKTTEDGIARKIYYQIKSLEEKGYIIDYLNPYEKYNQKIYKITRRIPFLNLKNWGKKIKKISDYSFIYIRKPWYMDGDLIRFMKYTKKINPKVIIILEIPTYPYDSELKGVKNLTVKIKDKIWRKHLHKYVNIIATYSKDKEIFGIKTINIVNAIDVKNHKRNIPKSQINNTINIMACSRLEYWHGYDRALAGLKKYYGNISSKIKYDIVLHIVGDGGELEKYRSYVRQNNLSEHVIMHGFLKGEKLNNVYDTCIVGLDSLGRHRSGVYYNSSLKSKEYAANGLIIISGVKSEFDADKTYKYYYRVPANDTPLDYNQIMQYIEKLLKKESLQEIQENITKYAEDNFDYSIAMNPIINYIKKECDTKE